MSPATMGDLIASGPHVDLMVARLVSLCWRPDVECYYFGWMQTGGGHCLHTSRGHDYDLEHRLEHELVPCLDAAVIGGLCWNSPQSERRRYDHRDETEGLALLTQRNGWTVIAFWDRSGDKRGACNSSFIVRGELTFEQIVRVARHRWPQVWQRFTFDVVQVDRSGKRVG